MVWYVEGGVYTDFTFKTLDGSAQAFGPFDTYEDARVKWMEVARFNVDTATHRLQIIERGLPPYVRKPDWSRSGLTHDWRNHVPNEIRAIWYTFTEDQLAALYGWADKLADNEEWD